MLLTAPASTKSRFDSGSVLRYRMGWLIYKAI
jgi:hypothetical protein